MTRTLPAAVSAAIAEDVTRPIYLIHMAWDVSSPDVGRYIATYDSPISWNSITWAASGAEVTRLGAGGGSIRLPNGDDDPWLDLVSTETPRGRAVEVYEYHTDFTASPHDSDATLLFSGIMDGSEVTLKQIEIDFIDSLRYKKFPNTSIDAATFTHLLAAGSRIYWGPDVVLVKVK
jgi:hypothetical protein